MKEMSLQEHLRSLGAHNGFFGSGLSGTFIGYDPMGEFGFQALESGLINKFKKQFIPMTEVFPKNRKKIWISLCGFDAHQYVDLYGIGSPEKVYKNYQKACIEISKKIHGKIQKKVSSGEDDYDSAFIDEEEFFNKEKIYNKNKIFSSDTALLPEDLDCLYENSKEWNKYHEQSSHWDQIFGIDGGEAYFPYPYKKKKTQRAFKDCFLLKHKKYSFIFDVYSLCDNTHITRVKL